jgi:hypothetical protein
MSHTMRHVFPTEDRGLNSDKANLIPLLIIIASFGHYISFTLGLRTEHVVIYTLFPVAVATILIRKTSTLLSYPPLFSLLFFWIAVTLWTLGSTFTGEPKYGSFFRMLASLENYVQFIAIIFVIGAFIRCNSQTEAKKLFYNACKILILLLTMNACVSFISLFFDTSDILLYFQAPPADNGWNVAVGSRKNGRFMGVFNQPVECGLAYSIGLFAWVYIISVKLLIKMKDIFFLLFLFVGGVLSVSKVFIFGGLPLYFIYLIWATKLKNLLKLKNILAGIIALFIIIFLSNKWDEIGGLNYLLRFFTAPIDLSTITGGRFDGDDGTTGVMQMFVDTWTEAPIHGLGFARFGTLDNGYIEFFSQGGLIGLFFYIFILFNIGLTGLKNCRKHREGKFLLILFVLIVGAGVGAPVLTLNRVSAICCVFIMLAYYIFYLHKIQGSFKSNFTQGLTPNTNIVTEGQ